LRTIFSISAGCAPPAIRPSTKTQSVWTAASTPTDASGFCRTAALTIDSAMASANRSGCPEKRIRHDDSWLGQSDYFVSQRLEIAHVPGIRQGNDYPGTTALRDERQISSVFGSQTNGNTSGFEGEPVPAPPSEVSPCKVA